MTENKAEAQPENQPENEQDVEGHSMYINPGLAADLARSRSKELDREVRERNHAKETKEAKRK